MTLNLNSKVAKVAIAARRSDHLDTLAQQIRDSGGEVSVRV